MLRVICNWGARRVRGTGSPGSRSVEISDASRPPDPFILRHLVILAFAVVSAALPVSAATFTVDRTDDDANATGCVDGTPNDCSLRGAVIKANGAVGADTIVLPAGTYVLTIPMTDFEDGAANGDLDVNDDQRAQPVRHWDSRRTSGDASRHPGRLDPPGLLHG